MKKLLFPFFVIIGCAHLSSAQSEALEGLVEKIVEPYLKNEGTHSLSVGIIEGGFDYHYEFGKYTSTASEETSEENPAALKFPLGSSSKIFTAAILMQMIGEQKLSLADPIHNLLLYNFKNPTLQKLNTHLLASHQSGLPMRPQNYHLANKDPKDPFGHYTSELSFEYLDVYRESKKNYPIGKFRFSNYNYAVLGQILTTQNESSWQELFDHYINHNYNLSCAADLPTESEALIPIHNINGKEIAPLQYGLFAPTLGVYADMGSCLKFMNVWIDAVHSEEWNHLQECLIEHCETDRKHVAGGYAWFIYPRSKKNPPVYTISGKTDGSWSFFAMIPETKTAVIILSNSKHSVDELGIEILDLINR